MAKFHVNEEGNPGQCSAQDGNCPFGADAPHFSTAEDARTHFEAVQSLTASLTGAKKKSVRDFVTPPARAVEIADFSFTDEDLYQLYRNGNELNGSVEEPPNNERGEWRSDHGDDPTLCLNVETEVFDDDGNLIDSHDQEVLWAPDDIEAADASLASALPSEVLASLRTNQYVKTYRWEGNKRITTTIDVEAVDVDKHGRLTWLEM